MAKIEYGEIWSAGDDIEQGIYAGDVSLEHSLVVSSKANHMPIWEPFHSRTYTQ